MVIKTLLILTLFIILPVTAQARDTLRIGISQYPSTLNPNIDAMAAKTYLDGFLIRPLTIHDASWKGICMLCVELPSFANGLAKIEGKGIAATYQIRPEAKWGDGTPITVKDVLFTWKAGKNPQAGFSNYDLFANQIVDITPVDDKTFILHFDKQRCDFELINDFEIMPAHLEEAVFDLNPQTYKDRTLYDTDPLNPGLYFGPWKLAAIEKGAGFTLEENPHWWGAQKPGFKKIIIKTIENSAALSAQLLSGDIDYISGELGLTLDQALSLEKKLDKDRPGEFTVTYKPGLTYEHIDLNLDSPVISDVRVRQALLYGINREAISLNLFGGKQLVANTDINPLDSVYVADVQTYGYAPDTAAGLLEDAGWKMGDDGYRYNEAKEKLVFVLMTTAGNKSRELIEQAIADDLKKIGVETRIENETPRVLFGDTMRKRTFKGGVMYAWMSSPKNVPRTTLHSTSIPTPANNYAGQNATGYKDADTDAAIDGLETVCEGPENKALWTKLQQSYAKNLPALPLYFRSDAFIVPTWLKGLVPTGHQYSSTYWAENWSASE